MRFAGMSLNRRQPSEASQTGPSVNWKPVESLSTSALSSKHEIFLPLKMFTR